MFGIIPNNTGMPSHPSDNPVLAPLLGFPEGTDLNIGEVDESANIANEGMGYIATPQGPVNMLMETRHKFPYLAIRPYPTIVITTILAAGVAKELHLPVGLVMGTFKGTANYFVSNAGKAQMPVQGDGDITQSLVNPDGISFYLGNMRSLSLVSPVDGCVVSLYGHRFEELPRY